MSNVLTDLDDSLSGGGVLIGQVVELSEYRPKVELNGMVFLKFGYLEDTDYAPELEPLANSMRLFEPIHVDWTETPNAIGHRDNVVLVSGTHGRGTVSKSSDYGQTWQKVVLQANTTALSGTVTYCGHNGSGHIWILSDHYPKNYFHRSVDDGESFIRTPQGGGHSMTVFAANHNGVVMAVGGSYLPSKVICKSIDFGESWQGVGPIDVDGNVDTIVYSKTNTWVGGTQSNQNLEIIFSQDDGSTWQKASLPSGLTSRIHAITTDDNGHWLALTDNSSGKCFIRSSDDGKTWTMGANLAQLQAQTGLSNIHESYSGTRRFIYRYGEWMLFTYDSPNGLVIASNDHGLTWQRRSDIESTSGGHGFGSAAVLDNSECLIGHHRSHCMKAFVGVGEFGENNDRRYVRIK